MNLVKLFEMQRQLDAHIEKEHPRQEGEDRLAKKILALQVELGELANENRCFKYWSNDQKPRTNHRFSHMDTGRHEHGSWSVPVYKDGQLEEYVDCLHFILSIGLELGMPHQLLLGNAQENETLDDDFIALYGEVHTLYLAYKCQLNKKVVRGYYESVFEHFLTLGERLGYTWEQIEEAYMKKNTENHSRQERGY
ncbi:dUTP diphosphatase [uncultured Anoxybacillus sp.]|uniref:dUTP diphosphatase n=1 Tax=uncultured Anoxybacillus sp. TaxID=263860 RepID=UPI002613ABCE|nr:dUTP diphosphatase [uncultured Anoxybacillus sp.]